eukprot:6174261-Pleurochrysis_carterae.AAC.1
MCFKRLRCSYALAAVHDRDIHVGQGANACCGVDQPLQVRVDVHERRAIGGRIATHQLKDFGAKLVHIKHSSGGNCGPQRSWGVRLDWLAYSSRGKLG